MTLPGLDYSDTKTYTYNSLWYISKQQSVTANAHLFAAKWVWVNKRMHDIRAPVTEHPQSLPASSLRLVQTINDLIQRHKYYKEQKSTCKTFEWEHKQLSKTGMSTTTVDILNTSTLPKCKMTHCGHDHNYRYPLSKEHWRCDRASERTAAAESCHRYASQFFPRQCNLRNHCLKPETRRDVATWDACKTSILTLQTTC